MYRQKWSISVIRRPWKNYFWANREKTCLSSESCYSHITVFVRQGFCSLEFQTNGRFKGSLFWVFVKELKEHAVYLWDVWSRIWKSFFRICRSKWFVTSLDRRKWWLILTFTSRPEETTLTRDERLRGPKFRCTENDQRVKQNSEGQVFNIDEAGISAVQTPKC